MNGDLIEKKRKKILKQTRKTLEKMILRKRERQARQRRNGGLILRKRKRQAKQRKSRMEVLRTQLQLQLELMILLESDILSVVGELKGSPNRGFQSMSLEFQGSKLARYSTTIREESNQMQHCQLHSIRCCVCFPIAIEMSDLEIGLKYMHRPLQSRIFHSKQTVQLDRLKQTKSI